MIKIMTYNIQHGIDYVHRLNTKEVVVNLDKVADIIKEQNPDIIALNEVYDAPEEDLKEQAKYIANKIEYFYYFGKSINIRGGEYGNAILSKYPMSNIKVHMIPDAIEKTENVFYETRSIIQTEINVNDTIYNVFVTHFGLAKEEQTNATKLLLDLIDEKKHVIVMGDLNSEPYSDNIKLIKEKLKSVLEDSILTFPSVKPVMRIDYIFVSNDICFNYAQALDVIFSDHLPIIACIK